MAAAFRASAVGNNGQTAVKSSVATTIPGTAVAGDYALLCVESSWGAATATTPSGWSLLSGPDEPSSSSVSWLFGKTLVSGDPGSSVTVTLSTTSRVVSGMIVFSGVTASGVQVQSLLDSTSGSTISLPTATSVPSGAAVGVFFATRDASASAPSVTMPSSYTAAPSSASNMASPNVAVKGGYLITSSSGSVGGDTAAVSPSAMGTGYVVALSASSTGGTVTLTGATAQGSGTAGLGTVVIAAAPPPVWPPDPYRAAVRNGITVSYTLDASLSGSPVAGATGLQLVSGTSTDTTAPGVRRQLNATLPPIPGLFDLLNVPGTLLKVTAHTSVNSVPLTDIPMGVYLAAPKMATGGGGITLNCSDKWKLIQRAKIIGVGTSWVGWPVTQQIAQMIKDAIGPAEPVNITATSTAIMGSQTWTGDRAQAIIDLANGIGAWVYFDRDGVATVADIPTIGADADWLIDASPSGVLMELDREGMGDDWANVVVLSSSSAAGQAFAAQTVWDSDPTSPTYAGTDPWHGVGTGPAGISVYDYTSPLPLDNGSALQAAGAQLAKMVGIASTPSGTVAPNPAMDAFDVIDILPPRERYDIARIVERCVVDTVTHQLDVSQPMTFTGRSTRTTGY